MQAAAIDFDAQQFLQPHVAEVYLAPEVIEQGKLAGLVGRFKHHDVMPERLNEAVRICRIELAFSVEKPDATSALSSFNHQLQGSSVQPAATLLDEGFDGVLIKRPAVLLSQFELHVESKVIGHAHDLARPKIRIGESFAAFDTGDANVGA